MPPQPGWCRGVLGSQGRAAAVSPASGTASGGVGGVPRAVLGGARSGDGGVVAVLWDPSSCQAWGSPGGLGQARHSASSLGQAQGQEHLLPAAFPWLQRLRGFRNPLGAVERKLLGALVLLCLFGCSYFSAVSLEEKKNIFKENVHVWGGWVCACVGRVSLLQHRCFDGRCNVYTQTCAFH